MYLAKSLPKAAYLRYVNGLQVFQLELRFMAIDLMFSSVNRKLMITFLLLGSHRRERI